MPNPNKKPAKRGTLVIDPKTGDKRIKIDDVAPIPEGSVVASLWDILHGGTALEGKDGKTIVVRPVTLATLAKLEAMNAEFAESGKPGGNLSHTIKFLTVMLNDRNSRPADEPALTEDQVGEMLDGTTMPLVLALIEETLRPLLPPRPPSESPPDDGAAGPGSSTGSSSTATG